MDHTKKTTFVGFVNVDKNDKYWVDGHFEFGTDAPTLFRFNTKDEKETVKSIAQGYLDNWGFSEVEMVIFEVKSRHPVKLKKRTEAEKEEERREIIKQAAIARGESSSEPEPQPDVESTPESTPKKRRGRKPKSDATIQV